MFDDLMDSLEQLSTQDVRQSTIDEITALCANPVFRLLCDLCDVLSPRNKKKAIK